MISRSNAVAYEYPSFPRKFVSYRWFKPLLVTLLTFVFMTVFTLVVVIAAMAVSGNADVIATSGTGYDDMNAYTLSGALINLGSIAVLIPALALAALIVGDRPFSSYTSSRGGWSWPAFVKCLVVGLALLVALNAIEMLIDPTPGNGVNQFTVAGIIAVAILVPLQCMAEEYIFRGLLLQTFASWFKFPVIAIILQAVAFASLHPYNLIGVASIFVTGVVYGVVAWQTKGLEASSAVHIVNNLFAFYLVGFGMTTMTSEIDVVSFLVGSAADILYAVIVIVAGKKFNWFAPTGDGAAAFNEKKLAKKARKEQRRMQRLQRKGQLVQPQASQQQVMAPQVYQPQPILQQVPYSQWGGPAPEPPCRSSYYASNPVR